MIKEGCFTKELQKPQLNSNIYDDGITRLYGRSQNVDLPEDLINTIP